MKKNTLALLLAAVIAITLMPNIASAASTDVPTVIWYNVGDTPENLAQWHEVTNAYLEEKIGVRVDYRPIPWSDWGPKQNTIINSGENFDIMFTDYTLYGGYVAMNAFEDLTELLPQEAPELYAFIPEEVWLGVRSPKGMFAVPVYKDSARTVFNLFDDTLVQKYNADYASITTRAKLDEYFRTVKAGEGASYYPFQLTKATAGGANSFSELYDGLGASLPAIGVKMDDESRTVVNMFETADVIENLQYRHSWYQDGIINPDANVATEQNLKRPYFAGVGWPGAVSIWQLAEGIEKYDIVKTYGPYYTTESIQGSLNSISVNSKNKAAALKLLEFVNLDHKARDMFAFGIEGVNFEYVEPTVVRMLDEAFNNMSRYSQATFFTMSTVEGGDKNQYDEIKAQNAEATPSIMLGFMMDTEPVQDEISACLTVCSKYALDLWTGVSDPDVVLPQLISELKAVGLQEVMVEAQRQIDEFYK
jgi:putative aldouronate transport system substrate-binding protein